VRKRKFGVWLMTKEEKIWIILGGVAGILCVELRMFLDDIAIYRYVIGFICASMTLCINLLSLIFISEKDKENVSYMIKILIWNQAVVAMIAFVYTYISFIGQKGQYSGEAVWLQSQVVDLVSLSYCIALVKYGSQKVKSSYFILVGYIFACGLCLIMTRSVIHIMTFVVGNFNIVIWAYLLVDEQYLGESDTKNFGVWVKPYIGMMLFEYIVILCFQIISKDYFPYQFLLAFLQSLILFISVYCRNVRKPWKEKQIAMEQMRQTIDVQQKNCEKIVNLSHELKTPVNVIKSALTILSMDYAQEDIKEQINDNQKRCQKIMNIIQDMIDIQKIKTKLLQSHSARYNVVELIENVVDAFAIEMYPDLLIFDTTEEEMFSFLDYELCQQGCMLLLGFLLKEKEEKLMIRMAIDEEGYINIQVVSPAIAEFQWRKNYLAQEKNEKENLIADNLTVQLILIILQLAQGEICFNADEKSDQMTIKLMQNIEGEEKWIGTENIQVMQEKIRCRYRIV